MTTATRAGGPGAWLGDDIAEDPTWIARCPDAVVRDLRAAIAVVVDRIERSGASRRAAVDVLGPTARWSPALVDFGASLRAELLGGRGFTLVRGLPVEEFSALGHEIACWLVCAEVGVPIHQNADRDEIIRVTDAGKDFAVPGVRAYETAARLDYHSDSSDVVALYCIRPAMRGGISTIVSSVAVHDAVVDARPDLVGLLYEHWPQASPVDMQVRMAPICARNERGKIFTRYGRRYIDTAAEYDASIEQLSAAQVEVLDLYDSFLHDPRFALDMAFQPGDIQLLNNYSVMHARTDFVDWPEPERRRELLRMWLIIEDGLDLPDAFVDSGFIPRSAADTNLRSASVINEGETSVEQGLG